MLGQHSTSNPTLQVFVTWLKKNPFQTKICHFSDCQNILYTQSYKKFKVIEYKALWSKTTFY